MFLPRLGHVTYTYKSIQKPLDGRILFLKIQYTKPGLPMISQQHNPMQFFRRKTKNVIWRNALLHFISAVIYNVSEYPAPYFLILGQARKSWR